MELGSPWLPQRYSAFFARKAKQKNTDKSQTRQVIKDARLSFFCDFLGASEASFGR